MFNNNWNGNDPKYPNNHNARNNPNNPNHPLYDEWQKKPILNEKSRRSVPREKPAHWDDSSSSESEGGHPDFFYRGMRENEFSNNVKTKNFKTKTYGTSDTDSARYMELQNHVAGTKKSPFFAGGWGMKIPTAFATREKIDQKVNYQHGNLREKPGIMGKFDVSKIPAEFIYEGENKDKYKNKRFTPAVHYDLTDPNILAEHGFHDNQRTLRMARKNQEQLFKTDQVPREAMMGHYRINPISREEYYDFRNNPIPNQNPNINVKKFGFHRTEEPNLSYYHYTYHPSEDYTGKLKNNVGFPKLLKNPAILQAYMEDQERRKERNNPAAPYLNTGEEKKLNTKNAFEDLKQKQEREQERKRNIGINPALNILNTSSVGGKGSYPSEEGKTEPRQLPTYFGGEPDYSGTANPTATTPTFGNIQSNLGAGQNIDQSGGAGRGGNYSQTDYDSPEEYPDIPPDTQEGIPTTAPHPKYMIEQQQKLLNNIPGAAGNFYQNIPKSSIEAPRDIIKKIREMGLIFNNDQIATLQSGNKPEFTKAQNIFREQNPGIFNELVDATKNLQQIVIDDERAIDPNLRQFYDERPIISNTPPKESQIGTGIKQPRSFSNIQQSHTDLPIDQSGIVSDADIEQNKDYLPDESGSDEEKAHEPLMFKIRAPKPSVPTVPTVPTVPKKQESKLPKQAKLDLEDMFPNIPYNIFLNEDQERQIQKGKQIILTEKQKKYIKDSPNNKNQFSSYVSEAKERLDTKTVKPTPENISNLPSTKNRNIGAGKIEPRELSSTSAEPSKFEKTIAPANIKKRNRQITDEDTPEIPSKSSSNKPSIIQRSILKIGLNDAQRLKALRGEHVSPTQEQKKLWKGTQADFQQEFNKTVNSYRPSAPPTTGQKRPHTTSSSENTSNKSSKSSNTGSSLLKQTIHSDAAPKNKNTSDTKSELSESIIKNNPKPDNKPKASQDETKNLANKLSKFKGEELRNEVGKLKLETLKELLETNIGTNLRTAVQNAINIKKTGQAWKEIQEEEKQRKKKQ